MSLAIEIILVLVSIMLIVAVLMQKSKSAGLGAAYGSDTETFGVKGREARKDQQLKKVTLICACVIAVLALVLMCLG